MLPNKLNYSRMPDINPQSSILGELAFVLASISFFYPIILDFMNPLRVYFGAMEPLMQLMIYCFVPIIATVLGAVAICRNFMNEVNPKTTKFNYIVEMIMCRREKFGFWGMLAGVGIIMVHIWFFFGCK